MTVFGFLATIVICGTVAASIPLLHKFPITVRTHKKITVDKPAVTTEKPDNTAIEEELNKIHEAQNDQGMDNLIAAVNELMGIQTAEETKVNGEA